MRYDFLEVPVFRDAAVVLGEDDYFFSCTASKTSKQLCNCFRPHHWCFTFTSVHQFFFRWMFLLLLGAFSQDSQTHTFVRSLTKLQCCSAGCLLPWDALVCLLSTKLLWVHLWGGIVLFSFERWSDTRWDNKMCQMERSSTVASTGLQTTSVFCLLSAHESQLCLICWWQRTWQWEGGQGARWDQPFHPSPQAQVTMTKAKATPAGLRWWSLSLGRERSLPPKAGAVVDLASLNPRSAERRKNLPLPPRSIAGISSAAIHTTTPLH